MDEDISIINTNTRNEKIKNFFVNNKKNIIFFFTLIVFIFLIFFGFKEFQNKKKINISNLYNSTIIQHSQDNKKNTKEILIKIINEKDATYSPLSLYFLLDNRLILNRQEMNNLFDIVIEETSLENEIKNLIIYKKALYNADEVNESELLKILGPIINSESIWSSHALYLVAEFLYDKNEKIKSKEFYNKILNTENSNMDLRKEAQKRLNRDLSD